MTGADEAREQGRPVVARVRHGFQPGWVTRVPAPAKPKGAFAVFHTEPGPDLLRCRVCGRAEGHASHAVIG